MNRIHRAPLSGVVIAAVLCTLPALILAKDAAVAVALPEASTIIARYVDAVGGAETLKKHKSMSMTGEFQMPANGINGALEVHAMAPDKLSLRVEIPGMGTMREGYDGKVGWSMDPMSGPRLKEGKELAQTAFEADYYGTLHEADRYQSMKTVAKEEFQGAQAYKLELVTKQGEEITEYFDAESGLLIGAERVMESPMGPMGITQANSDYKEFGGLMLPTKTVVSVGPMQQILKISDVSFGSVEPSQFELPVEVKALVGE